MVWSGNKSMQVHWNVPIKAKIQFTSYGFSVCLFMNRFFKLNRTLIPVRQLPIE